MSVPGRRVLVFVPVVVTLVLVAFVGALIIVQNQRNADLVVQADNVGDSFFGDVVIFRSTVVAAVAGADTADPGELRGVVERALADAPELEATSDYGIERSARYAEARRAEKTFLKPYRELMRELHRADVALAFVAEAREALGVRATDFVGFGLLDNSRAVRQKLIPAFIRARDDFDAVQVPEGQEQLAANVAGALQYVIDQATRLATSIESNKSFSFSYADEYRIAREAVDGYATVIAGDLAEAITRLADDSGSGP